MRKLVALAVLLVSLSLPLFAFAQLSPGGSGLTTTGDAAYGTQAPTDLDPGYFIGTYIIRPILGFTGVIFLVLMVYAGFLWMTSAGNGKQVEKAKQILTTAVIGAAIMASAYVITSTVITALSTPSQAGDADEVIRDAISD